jgi:hypothetical protein
MAKQAEITVSGHALYDNYISSQRCDTHGVISLKAHSFEEEARASRGILVHILLHYNCVILCQ